MLYYDDRDYLDYNNIDELYDYNVDDSYIDSHIFAEEENDQNDVWEYDYHNLKDELIDD